MKRYSTIDKIVISPVSEKEIRKSSVCIINCKKTAKNEFINSFTSLNSKCMGTTEKLKICPTCELSGVDCPGHYGYTSLNSRIYNPLFMKEIMKFANLLCDNCGEIILTKSQIEKIKKGERFEKLSNISKIIINKLNPKKSQSPKKKKDEEIKCESCGSVLYFYDIKDNYLIKRRKTGIDAKYEFVDPEFLYEKFINYTPELMELMGLDPNYFHPKYLVPKNIYIIPTTARVNYKIKENKREKEEDDLTSIYNEIFDENDNFAKEYSTDKKARPLEERFRELMYSVAGIVNDTNTRTTNRKKKMKNIYDRIEKKKGHIRNAILAKIINSSVRTVIEGDPKLPIDTIGFPEKFAMKLTYDMIITKDNIDEARRYLYNGPNIYPGANFYFPIGYKNFINNSRDKSIKLKVFKTGEDRINKVKLEIGGTLKRHLIDGDFIAINRPPTLHRGSLVSGKIKIISNKVLRLNQAIVTPLNADFDGDMMHAIVFNTNGAKSELEHITDVKNLIISGSSSTPQIIPIHDSIAGIYTLSKYGKKISYEDALYILGECDMAIKAEIKKRNYTGYEIIEFILPKNFNFSRKNTIIMNSKIISGEINKGILYSMIHKINILFGQTPTINFIYNSIQIALGWNNVFGISCGYKDVMISNKVTEKIDKSINMIYSEIDGMQDDIQNDNFIVPFGWSPETHFESRCISIISSNLAEVGKWITEDQKEYEKKTGEMNRMHHMIDSGSKGKITNIIQLSGILGQQNVQGKRIEMSYNQRSYPYYPKNNNDPRDRGLCINGFLSGLEIDEQESHGSAAREGLMATALKTSDVGYMSRRFSKALGSIRVHYDGTTRNANNNILGFLYGSTSFDAEKVQNINLEWLMDDDITMFNKIKTKKLF